MHKTSLTLAAAAALLIAAPSVSAADRVTIANGIVEGTTEANGVRAFKGIPFAEPPVGDLRWKPPQPVKNWDGVRQAAAFGPRCMQRRVFGDMVFRSNGMSEDCLYLNVWTPAAAGGGRLPVLVYFYGGGFIAGDGSEPRYDGESMARKGIVALTVNYRLTVFGFFAHPELTKESPQHASGNQDCSIRRPRSPGCGRTSPRSAAIPPVSRLRASRPDRSPSAPRWRRRCRRT
jgi:para-nitrobenzyl esterase